METISVRLCPEDGVVVKHSQSDDDVEGELQLGPQASHQDRKSPLPDANQVLCADGSDPREFRVEPPMFGIHRPSVRFHESPTDRIGTVA